MYQLIISKKINSQNASANVKDIFALESFLSPQEFKDTFLNSINEFIEQLKPYRKTVERTYKVFNNVTQQFKHVSSEFNNAERPYIEACIAENEFIVENGVFIHNGFKAEKIKFITKEGHTDFDVHELFDWYSMKKHETSENFEKNRLRYI